jgi:ferredoxin
VRGLKVARRTVQLVFLASFIALAFRSAYPPLKLPAADLFLRLDPLAAVVSLVTTHDLSVTANFWPAWVLLGLTLLSSRFFCAWICPLGTCFDAAGACKPRALRYYEPGASQIKDIRSGVGRNRRTSLLKYAFLALVIAGAFAGVNMLYIGSPLVLMNRSIYQVLLPAVPFILVALLLVAFLYRPRFWCEDLCPMGALMSLVSAAGKRLPARLSPLCITKDTGACTSCGACFRSCDFGIREPFVSQRDGRLRSADCTACGDCVSACPEDGALSLAVMGSTVSNSGTGRARPRSPAAPGTVVDPGGRFAVDRRQFLESAGLGAVLLAGYSIGLPRRSTPVLRMPGAQDESLFLARCNRCEACARACPAACLEPMGVGAGLQKLWTPEFVPARAGCIYDQCDQACQRVCPAGAIERVDPSRVAIGLAHVHKSRCLGWLGEPCLVCQERCRFNAIEADGLRPSVITRKCTGCGACEETCPTAPVSIKVFPKGVNPRWPGGGGGRLRNGGG